METRFSPSAPGLTAPDPRRHSPFRWSYSAIVTLTILLVGLLYGSTPSKQQADRSNLSVHRSYRSALLHTPDPSATSGNQMFLVSDPSDSLNVHIFLYDSSGNPVDVTGLYSYQEGHIYDGYSNLVGNIPNAQDGYIYNQNNVLIGFITTTSP